jgi:hypothetical protein
MFSRSPRVLKPAASSFCGGGGSGARTQLSAHDMLRVLARCRRRAGARTERTLGATGSELTPRRKPWEAIARRRGSERASARCRLRRGRSRRRARAGAGATAARAASWAGAAAACTLAARRARGGRRGERGEPSSPMSCGRPCLGLHAWAAAGRLLVARPRTRPRARRCCPRHSLRAAACGTERARGGGGGGSGGRLTLRRAARRGPRCARTRRRPRAPRRRPTRGPRGRTRGAHWFRSCARSALSAGCAHGRFSRGSRKRPPRGVPARSARRAGPLRPRCAAQRRRYRARGARRARGAPAAARTRRAHARAAAPPRGL